MSTLKTGILALAALFLAATTSANGPGQGQCSDFRWARHSGGEHGAMLVDARLDQRPVRLQLDTGSDISVLYGRLPDMPATGRLAGSLSLGPLELGHLEFVEFPHVTPGAADGVIGLDALLGHQLLIDYPAGTLCLVDHTPEGNWLEIPSRLRRGKLFLFSQVGDSMEWGYFFDTGASLYHLLVDRARWQQLTGRTGSEADNRLIEGSGWGRPLTTVGAAPVDTLRIGPLTLVEPMVHFVLEQPQRFTAHPARANGLIGNAPFLDKVIRIDLRGARPLFAVRRD